MVNMFKMIKEAASMQRELKEIQKGLARQSFEYSSGDNMVTATVRGDLTLDSVKIKPEALTALKLEHLERRVTQAVNGALETAKKKAGEKMAKLTGGLGLNP
jgi:DNA-binding YbaB/EbfC family protein